MLQGDLQIHIHNLNITNLKIIVQLRQNSWKKGKGIFTTTLKWVNYNIPGDCMNLRLDGKIAALNIKENLKS